MRHFHIRALMLSVILVGAGIGLSLSTAQQARADVNHDTIAVETPRTDTPIVLDGVVESSIQLHDRVIVGGDFSRVQTRDGEIVDRGSIFAYDINTGELIDDFKPVLDGEVRTMFANPADDSFYLGGTFTQVDGQFRQRLAKVDYDGTVDATFRPKVSAAVTSIDVHGGVVYAGGPFAFVNDESHQQLGAVDATTGANVPGFDIAVEGPLGQNGNGSVLHVEVHPDGSTLFVAANAQTFVDANGSHDRFGIAFIDLNTFQVTPWRTQWYEFAHVRCNTGDLQLEGAALSLDGSQIVLTERGHFLCDKVISFETADDGVNDPKWVTAAHDSIFSAKFTNNAVYVGGHFCYLRAWGSVPTSEASTFAWPNKPQGCDLIDGNEDIDEFIARQQIAALDIETGQPLDWNPRSNAFTAVFDIQAIDRGILLGQDSNRINDLLTGRHAFLDFGGTTPVFEPPVVPVQACTAVSTEDGVRVDWLATDDRTQIRRDGGWLATVTGQGTFTDIEGSNTNSYVLRVRESGGNVDYPCPFPEEPEPEPQLGPLECVAALEGDDVVLHWGDNGATSEVVRRNGGWLATVTGQSTLTDTPGFGNHEYVLRLRIDGSTVDINCDPSPIVIAEPQPVDVTCTASLNGTRVALDWTAVDGRAQIRRDGNWLATVTDQTTRTDSPSPGAYSYLLRYFPGGVATDVLCDPTPITVPELEPVDPACTVLVGEESAFLEFTANTSGTQMIRIDNKWLATVNGLTDYTHTPSFRQAGPEGDYVLRLNLDGVITDTPCTDITPEPEPFVSLAFNKAATQSSTAHGGLAERAVDGNTSGDFGAGSVTHTVTTTAQPWWQVDLGAPATISTIDLWNRTGCCPERLADVVIFVSDTDMTDRTLAELEADPAVASYSVDGVLGETTPITADTTGQFVRVQLRGDSAILSLAEVVVTGSFQ